MHSLNYAPGSFGGGRSQGGRSALQPLCGKDSLLGTSGRLPCPEKLEVFTGVQPWLESYENLEEKWMPWTCLWVAVASEKPCIYEGCGQILTAWGPTSAPHSSHHPVARTRSPASPWAPPPAAAELPGPWAWEPEGRPGVRWCQGSDQAQRLWGRVLASRASLFSSPPWV